MIVPYVAQWRLQNAVQRNLLTRPNKCGACRKACKPHGHHPDYQRPLDVEWLCPKCHRAKHWTSGIARFLQRCAEGEQYEQSFRAISGAILWQGKLEYARKRLTDKGERLSVLIVRDGSRVTVGPDRAALVKPGKRKAVVR